MLSGNSFFHLKLVYIDLYSFEAGWYMKPAIEGAFWDISGGILGHSFAMLTMIPNSNRDRLSAV